MKQSGVQCPRGDGRLKWGLLPIERPGHPKTVRYFSCLEHHPSDLTALEHLHLERCRTSPFLPLKMPFFNESQPFFLSWPFVFRVSNVKSIYSTAPFNGLAPFLLLHGLSRGPITLCGIVYLRPISVLFLPPLFLPFYEGLVGTQLPRSYQSSDAYLCPRNSTRRR